MNTTDAHTHPYTYIELGWLNPAPRLEGVMRSVIGDLATAEQIHSCGLLGNEGDYIIAHQGMSWDGERGYVPIPRGRMIRVAQSYGLRQINIMPNRGGVPVFGITPHAPPK